MFIAFDGTDGCGKSTQVKKLCAYFENLGYDVIELDMGNSPIFEKYIKAMNNKELLASKEIREIIYYFEGVFTYLNVIKKNRKDKIIISDRYYLSYLSYGVANGINIDEIIYFIKNLEEPDYYFFIDTPIDVCEERIRKNRKFDFPEIGQNGNATDESNAFIEFQTIVKKNYYDNLNQIHIIVDGTLSENEIFEEIINAMH